MTDLPITRGDEFRAEAASEIEDAQSLLAEAQRLTDVSTDYRVAALKARWAAGRFENASTLLSHAEDADQDDHDRSRRERSHERGEYRRLDLAARAKVRWQEAVDGGEPELYTGELYDEYLAAAGREQS